MLQAQRVAAEAVAAVLAGRSLNRALPEALAAAGELPPGERAAALDLSYGVMRWYALLRPVLDALLRKPVTDPLLDALLLVGLYQLHAGRDPGYAVVDNAVSAAVNAGRGRARGLVNAVLRNFQRRGPELLEAARRDEAARYAHPAWWIARLKAEYPQHWAAILEADNLHPPMCLRINRRRANRASVAAEVAAQGLAASAAGEDGLILARPVPVERLPGFAEGRVSVQDLGAQLAAPLLDADDGTRVLDACAAPGGKACHLLERADLDLTALDPEESRLKLVRENLARLGLVARLACADARALDAWWDGRPFERILADVPCTASGVVRRHPDVKWLRRPADIEGFAVTQADILDALWQTLAPDGKLLYATCSLFPQENRLQVEAFLARHGDAERLPLPGLDPWASAEGQLLPDPQHDGFFYALLRKR